MENSWQSCSFVLVLVAIVLMTAKVTGWLRPKFGRKAYLLWLVWLLFPLGFIIYIYFAEIYTGWIG